VTSILAKSIRAAVWVHQCGMCISCGKDIEFSEATFEHVIPRKHGGEDSVDNCVVTCYDCNHNRGTSTLMVKYVPDWISDAAMKWVAVEKEK